MVSLVEALVATFPVVHELVGDAFFRAMAREFVRSSPPESPVLAIYGHYFADFVEEFGPARVVPYLASVARLEYARLSSIHSADAPVLKAVDPVLAGMDGAIEHLALVLHPSVRVVETEFASHSIWAAHNGAGNLEDVDVDIPEASVVSRVGDEVFVRRVTPAAATFVRALGERCDLGEAARRALQTEPEIDVSALIAAMFNQHAFSEVQVARTKLQ
jgi:hypothetical protein